MYVLGYNMVDLLHWHCRMFRPSSMKRVSMVIETRDQVMLTVQMCIEQIVEDK